MLNKIGKYQIIEEIGRGGMGCVYKAYDQTMDKHIALKTILSGLRENHFKRFIREAKLMAKFSHPNIVKIYDVGEDQSAPFIAMDFIEGQSLSQYLQKTSLDIRKFSQLMLKVGNAVQYAHDKGVIHRDLKPANIMLDKNLEPYVMDFGLSNSEKSRDKF